MRARVGPSRLVRSGNLGYVETLAEAYLSLVQRLTINHDNGSEDGFDLSQKKKPKNYLEGSLSESYGSKARPRTIVAILYRDFHRDFGSNW